VDPLAHLFEQTEDTIENEE